MTQENDSFSVVLPANLKPRATRHAERIGLPCPENFILLIVRQAWQNDHLASLRQHYESQAKSA